MGVRVLNRRRVLMNAEYSPMQYQREYESELRRKGSYWVIGQIDDIRDEMRGPFESRRDATKQMKALLAQYPTVVDDYGDRVERYLSVFESKPSRNPGGVVRRKMSREEMAETPHTIDKSGRAVLEDGSEYIWDSRFEQWSMWVAPRRANAGELMGPWEFGSEDIPLQRQYAEEVDELNEQIARTHDLKKIARLMKKRAAVSQAAYEADWGPRSNPAKIPAEMSAAEINRRLDQLDKLDSQVSHELIEAGRGHERPSEYLKQTDPLSMRARTIWDEKQKLYIEVEKRAGPGMRRLPRGFGPIRGY